MSSRHIWSGAAILVFGELMFASAGVCVRLASENLSNEMIVFFRNVFAVFVLLPLLLHGERLSLKTSVPGLHLFRGVMGLGAMYCFFYAMANMPLAEAMILKLTAPLFMPVIAWLWLSERISSIIVLAIAIGFAGIFLILSPASSESQPVAIVALCGGVMAAFAKTTIKRLSHTEPTARVVLYFALIGMVISLIPLAWAWVTPDSRGWALLIAIALLSTVGQLCLTRGLSYAEVGRMGIFTYTSVIFAALYGWFLWDEPVTALAFAGMCLVALSAVLAGRVRVTGEDNEDFSVR